jgi:peptide/nickel transport system permease protein
MIMEAPLMPPSVDNTTEVVVRVRKNVWQKLWRDPVARLGIIILACLYSCALFADFLAPYSMYFNDPDLANAAPTVFYFRDANEHLCWPYVHPVERAFDPATFRQIYTEKKERSYPLKLLVRGEDYKIFGLIPGNIHLFGVESANANSADQVSGEVQPTSDAPESGSEFAAPPRLFLLGTDINGRDNFSRLFFGAQKSLTIGFLGLFIAFPIGITYGGIAGFAGGIVDTVMMRVAEAIMSIPGFYLLIALAAILPPGMSSSERFALITVILSLIGWAELARVIRGMVLAIREEDFVQAALACGRSKFATIIRHVLPQTASFVIVAATLQVPNFILSESGLSFIGLGIQQPDASWGNMLKAALDNVNDLLNQPWLIAPGILIFITIFCFNSVGDVLRDVLDPKSHGVI